MFGRPPEGGLLSFEVGRGWFKEPTAFRRWAEHACRSFVRRRLCWRRSALLRCAIAALGVWRLLPFRALVPLFAKNRTVTCAHPERLRYLADETWGSCQKSGGFHQAGEEVVSLNSDWLCLRFSDLAICSGGIETGSINRFHGFWIRRQNYSI